MNGIDRYINNNDFIKWVLATDPGLDLYWANYIITHPEEKETIAQARKVVSKFGADSQVLQQQEKAALLSDIIFEINNKARPGKVSPLFIGLKYAAILVLFISLGWFFTSRYHQDGVEFDDFAAQEVEFGNESKLVGIDGATTILKNDHSKLTYSDKGELILDQTMPGEVAVAVTKKALNQLLVPYGKTAEVLLADGTKVFLNAGSRLAYPTVFTGDTREVFLIGEAYFEVDHDENHPFVVRVKDLIIKDLGTKFNVSSYDHDRKIETTLLEGKVAVEKMKSAPFTKDTELIPGQMYAYDKESKRDALREVVASDHILWVSGVMKFESEQLGTVLNKLERYYNIKFQLKEEKYRSIRISGKLQLKEDVNEVVGLVAKTASLQVDHSGGNLYTMIKY